jgi:hypothetical protein
MVRPSRKIPPPSISSPRSRLPSPLYRSSVTTTVPLFPHANLLTKGSHRTPPLPVDLLFEPVAGPPFPSLDFELPPKPLPPPRWAPLFDRFNPWVAGVPHASLPPWAVGPIGGHRVESPSPHHPTSPVSSRRHEFARCLHHTALVLMPPKNIHQSPSPPVGRHAAPPALHAVTMVGVRPCRVVWLVQPGCAPAP